MAMLMRSRRGGIVLTGAVLLAVAGCSGSSSGSPAATSGVSGATTGPAATATARSTKAAKPTTPKDTQTRGPAAMAPTGQPSVAISLAPAVDVGDPASLSSGVQVTVGKIRDVTVKANQPGEIAGPAAAVPITVKNTSNRPFSLGGMVVTVSYNKGVPGNQTTSGPSKPLTGALKVGATAKGTYVFNVPKKYASSLQVQVSSNESPTIVQFIR